MEIVEILSDIILAPFTTLKLGGKASFFGVCENTQDLIFGLSFASEKKIPYWILGGGSNTIVSDTGFSGIVLKNQIKSVTVLSETESAITIEVGAGENWDSFVLDCVNKGYSGIECLSGIPGSVGASPLQNIGAYGQEISETVISVAMLDPSCQSIKVKNEDCRFSYRNSRFKSGDWQNNIVTHVTFSLSKISPPRIKYPEVERKWHSHKSKTNSRIEELCSLRNLILNLRKSKSMLLDDADSNSRSVGSFFMNPILSESEKTKFENKIVQHSLVMPTFYPEGLDRYKVSAAWLIENSGFYKGYTRNGVGISTAHSLALININGTTQALLELADEIKTAVQEKFQVSLIREPVYLG